MERRAAELPALVKAFLATGQFKSCVLVCLAFAALPSDVVTWLWLLPRAQHGHFELVSGAFPGVQLSGTC